MTPPAIALLRCAVLDRPEHGSRALDASTLGWLIDSGFGPLLAHCAGAQPQQFDDAARQIVRAADRSALMLSEETFAVLERVLERLRESVGPRGCPLTLLKGVSVAQQLYPRRHWRLMRDIDLLVEPGDQPTLEAVLRDLGFQQRGSQPPEFFANHHHSMPFYHPDWRCWIEVHTALFRPDSRAAGIDGLRPHALVRVPVAHPHAALFRLSDEIQLVYTAVHWGTKLTLAGGLVPVMDTLLLLTRAGDTLDWDAVLRICENDVAARYLVLMLACLERHGLYCVPPAVRDGLAPGRRALGGIGTRLLLNIVDDYMASGRPLDGFTSEAVVNVRWETLLDDGHAWVKLLRLPWRLLFPPAPDRYDVTRLLRRGGSLLRRLIRGLARRAVQESR